MTCGTPVACSNTASLPEVAGDAAEYFEPSDAESIAGAIENVVLSEERWRELQTFGLQQAAKFHWRNFAQRHIRVYREFVGGA
jgi:glycosyltransferase involved in cell wall biosynthesis